MPQDKSTAAPESFQTFGDLLVYLRKRAQWTQDELGYTVANASHNWAPYKNQ